MGIFSGLNKFDSYLLIINVFGFILYLINKYLYSHTDEKNVDLPLTITSLLGGSLGIVIAFMIFDRKAEKGNMMSRVFVFSVLVIQIIIFLIVKGNISESLSFGVLGYFKQNKQLIVYLVGINLLAFTFYAIDKISAIRGRSRIRIVTLLALAFFGGSIGSLVAMYSFRHKTRQDYFVVGVPIIMVMQLVVIFYLMNLK